MFACSTIKAITLLFKQSLFKEDESTQREMNEGTEATLTLSRTRLPNFSSDETEILLTEVEMMFHRRTAGNRDPLALRKSKWQEIADKISAVSGMAREPKHLKKKLNDLRRRVRTRLAKIQADKRTRGAPSPSSRLSRLDERVLAIMPDLARSAVTGVDTLHTQLRSLEDNQSTSSLDRPMEEGHATPYLLQKTSGTGVHQVHIQVSPEGSAGLTMPQQIQTCPPFCQQQVGAEQPDIVSPAPSVHSPSLVLPFQSPNQHSVHLQSIVSTDFTAQDPEPCHSICEPSTDHLLEEADVKARHTTKQVGQPSRRSCTSPASKARLETMRAK
ncbi:Myb-related transcription factor, partner of profilin [Acipenser ruthenus]|uniref:Myb-related transcription factor, partner of profilin n=1 Tax=Acipenser ruthenus TaxID=7906 RepID=A0A662YQU2_ACIRT|nr:Myb-related transcription factor, partner of profilin [Acipenser ruthenus]